MQSAEIEHSDLGTSFKTHVQRMLMLSNNKLKCHDIERERCKLLRNCKKTLEHANDYEKAGSDSQVEWATMNACGMLLDFQSSSEMQNVL